MKVLFITHDTSRSGAPIVLLHLLRWLNANKPNVSVDVLALKGGKMEADFKNICRNYYNFEKATKKQHLTFFKRNLKRINLYQPVDKKDTLFSTLKYNQYDIVYANTVISIPIAVSISELFIHGKIVAHVHELNTVIKQKLPNLNNYKNKITHFISASELVSKNLTKNWNVEKNKVTTVYECAVTNGSFKNGKKEISKFFKVGAAGRVNYRKGYDIFIQVARYINNYYPEAKIVFEWLGEVDNNTALAIEEDIKKLDINDKVKFIGEIKNPDEHYNDFDVFLMTSREDPFPLVCIEVGQLGKPIISFDKAVGTNEILSGGGGFIVPYLSIERMAESIIKYYNNPNLRREHAELNKAIFSEFTPKIICPKIFSILSNK